MQRSAVGRGLLGIGGLELKVASEKIQFAFLKLSKRRMDTYIKI
jgi:hypothetical protein